MLVDNPDEYARIAIDISGQGDVAGPLLIRYLSRGRRFSDPRPRLCIEINTTTGIKHIEKAWDAICYLRQRLSESTGKGKEDDDLSYAMRECLLSMFDAQSVSAIRRLSYSQLADKINGMIADLLRVSLLIPNDINHGVVDGMIIGAFWGPTGGWFAFMSAMELMRWFGPEMNQTDATRRETLKRALVELQAGRPAFDGLPGSETGPPVTAENIRDRLKNWRRGVALAARLKP